MARGILAGVLAGGFSGGGGVWQEGFGGGRRFGVVIFFFWGGGGWPGVFVRGVLSGWFCPGGGFVWGEGLSSCPGGGGGGGGLVVRGISQWYTIQFIS